MSTSETLVRPPELPPPPPRRGAMRYLVAVLAVAAAVLLVLDWVRRAARERDAFDALADPSATAPPANGTGSITLAADWNSGLQTTGYLESPWLAGALWVLLAATIVAVGWRWVRRHRAHRRLTRPVLRRSGSALLLVVLLVLSGAATANAYVGYVPTVRSLFGDVGNDLRGGSRIEQLSIGAPELDVPPGPAYVYLPPGYSSITNRNKRYPVIYLLHGYPGESVDWVRAGDMQPILDKLISDRLIQPMIAVAPDASGGFVHDSEMVNQVGGPQLETYLTKTVPQTIDGKYRTIADRSARAIGGMSSGGYGALNLALRNQDIFSVSVSMMPYGDPGAVLASLFGGNKQLLQANTPSLYIPTTTFTQPLGIIYIAGSEDHQLATARQLYALTKPRTQDVALQIVAGATHTWRGASMDLPYGLVFFSQRVKVPADGSGG
ncbi:MAG TPA: alpha/beta hydrolase-fold protein [Mycobacteriales bacterium]|nr:alpha/beta hydrolase-fold protein [Mycobacteriales bacterium]